MQRSSWLSLILLLWISFTAVSGGRHRKHHHSSAIVVGTVSCDTCSKSSHFISGATVAVECGGDGLKSFREEVKTNEKGEFEAKLPASVGKNVDRIKSCSVKLVSSSEPNCAVAATATSSEIRFKSKKAGTHVFSAGFFTFKSELCSQKDLVGKGFPPVSPQIGEGVLPPLPVPELPLPPSLIPPVPGLPIPPTPGLPIPPTPGIPIPPTPGIPIPPTPGLPIPPVAGLPIPPVPGLPIPPVPGLPIPPVPGLPIPPVPGLPIPPVPGIPIPPASNPHKRKTTP